MKSSSLKVASCIGLLCIAAFAQERDPVPFPEREALAAKGFTEREVRIIEGSWPKLRDDQRAVLADPELVNKLDIFKKAGGSINPALLVEKSIVDHILEKGPAADARIFRTVEVVILESYGRRTGELATYRKWVFENATAPAHRESRVRAGIGCDLLTAEERIRIALSYLLEPGSKSVALFNEARNIVLQKGSEIAMRGIALDGEKAAAALRAAREGKIAPIAAALNSPLLEGIEAAISALGIETGPIDRAPLVAEGNSARMAVLTGQSAADVAQVQLLLGVEAYAAFKATLDETQPSEKR